MVNKLNIAYDCTSGMLPQTFSSIATYFDIWMDKVCNEDVKVITSTIGMKSVEIVVVSNLADEFVSKCFNEFMDYISRSSDVIYVSYNVDPAMAKKVAVSMRYMYSYMVNVNKKIKNSLK